MFYKFLLAALQRSSDQLFKRVPLQVQLYGPGVEASHFEHIADLYAHASRAIEDRVQHLILLLLAQAISILTQGARAAGNNRERGAQIM
jgi:hypothetical protein